MLTLKKHRGQEKHTHNNDAICKHTFTVDLPSTPYAKCVPEFSSVHHQNPVQFRMVSMRSDKPLCASPSLSQKFPPTLPLKRFQYSSFQGISSSASSFNASLLQTINGVMSLASKFKAHNTRSTPSLSQCCRSFQTVPTLVRLADMTTVALRPQRPYGRTTGVGEPRTASS